MGDGTRIGWCDTAHVDGSVTAGASWNPIRGTLGRWTCVRVSPGCVNCYAAAFNRRLGGPDYVVGADTPRLDEAAFLQPLHWRRPRRVFVCSMTDLFWDQIPYSWIDRIWTVQALAPQHTFLWLTKRPARLLTWFADPDLYDRVLRIADRELRARWPKLLQIGISNPARFPLRNLWIGVTAEDQPRWDERVPLLRQVPAAVRWVSLEPLLERVALRGDVGVDWLVVGGESGPRRRPFDPNWARQIRDQADAAGVPWFFKQAGGLRPGSGDVLDGRRYHAWPQDQSHAS